MIIASFIISGFAIVISCASLWLSRINSKIRRGRPLNRLEYRAIWVILGHEPPPEWLTSPAMREV